MYDCFTSISFADMDEEKNESKKQEKEKNFFSLGDKFSVSITRATPVALNHFCDIPVLLHTVETPPPNRL